MSRLNNLSQGNLGDILRRLSRLEMGTPLASSSMGRGRLRLYDGSVLLIENGALQVSGEATISGTLKVTGTMDVTGPTSLKGKVTITGDSTVSGKLDVTGPMATKGTLSVEGVTTLKNDLNVTSGGEIKAGNTRISPSASNGGIEFVSGGGIGGNGGTVAMRGSSNAGVLAGTNANLFAGSYSVDVRTTGVYFPGTPTAPGGATANVYMDSGGRLHRI